MALPPTFFVLTSSEFGLAGRSLFAGDETLVMTPVDGIQPTSVAAHPRGRRLYWASRELGVIGYVSRDVTESGSVIEGLKAPEGWYSYYKKNTLISFIQG